ncbi:ketoacyl-ACP synthase III [Kutzneria sp. NPDC051319]|uniref:3-oxoacyl-ACP synthase III family protein n=1 Tax=Kutzneria sp. NPDC051319 TaxID=3155047 RepID=UPI003447A88E
MGAIGVLGTGGFVPSRVVDNTTVGQWCGVGEDWILERTGVRRRRYARPDQPTSELAIRAAAPLLTDPSRCEALRMVMLATSTPDRPQPATASAVQAGLGLSGVAACDLNAVCCGFLYGLVLTSALLAAQGGTGLVIGADRYSSIMDRADRRTVTLFGDGAGAVLLGPVPDGYGIRGSSLVGHGELRELVRVPEDRRLFEMQGRAVKEYALDLIPKVATEALTASGLALDDISRFVFHQGNVRMVEACAEAMGVGMDRVPLTAPVFGNTAAASLALTLHHADLERPFRRGEHILLAGVGGGMTAGAVVLTWH